MTENLAIELESGLAPVAVRGHRRGRQWKQVTYAVHRRAEGADPPTDFPPYWSEADLAGWQLLMTFDGCFTGLTALQILGVSLPPIPTGCPVFIALLKNDPRPMRRGVHTSRHIRPVNFETIRGLRVAVPVEAMVAAARWLALVDLVAVVDNALYRGIVELDDLVLISRSRRPGARSLRAALAHVDGRAESLPESFLRILHESCEVAVEPQWVVVDANDVEIARADLLLLGTNSLHDYDGDEHEKAQRRVRDLRRHRRLDHEDYIRRGYTLGDLLRRAVTVLLDIDRAVGRPHDPARIRPWNDLVRQSLYVPAGRSAFLERIQPRRRGGGR